MKRSIPFLILMITSCASDPGQTSAPVTMQVGKYSPESAPLPVGVIPTALLHDAARNKDVDVSIDYPTRGGPFPVIVFSHGYGGSNHAYEPLISYWTSNGYLCIRPAHADAGALRQTMREMMTERRDDNRSRRRSAAARPPTQEQQVPQRNSMEEIWDREREPQWRNRVADIRLVLDSLDELERRFPELQGKMDHGKIGVGGHSYGAFTAMLIAGMHTFSDPPLQLADPRVRAVVAMSPQGIAANRGTTPRSWADVRVPMMYMTGTNDRGATEAEDANWRKEAFENSPPGDKYFVLLKGAGHLSFTGMTGLAAPLQRPVATSTSTYSGQPRGGVLFTPDRRIFDLIKITSLAFWDAYLKNEAASRELLEPAKYDASFTGAQMSAK